MANTTTLHENVRAPIDGSEAVRLATTGANWQATLSSVFSALGPSGAQGTPSFATITDVQARTVAGSGNYVQVWGYKTPGDGGGGIYQRVNSLPSYYVGDGETNIAVPPSFAAGGVPILVYTTTYSSYASIGFNSGGSGAGPTSQPILPGCLTIIVIVNDVSPTPPASYTDSAGNVYLRAVYGDSGDSFSSVALYYCANPVYAPPGTSFNTTGGARMITVYCFPGFTGAVLDQTAHQSLPVPGTNSGTTVSTGVLAAAPELVIGAVNAGASVAFTLNAPPATFAAGWLDLTTQASFHNAIACTIAPNTAPVTFAPTWTPTAFGHGITTLVATFKTFPSAAINASYWSWVPQFPLHLAQFGAAPDGVSEISSPLAQLTLNLAAIASASYTWSGVTISIGNPAIITISDHRKRADQLVRFATTGTLPTGIVAGQLYYIQYGSVTPNTFNISATTTFLANGQFLTMKAKGTPIATSGSQSGTHSMTVYGEGWHDIIVDPGIYNFTRNFGVAIGMNAGLQKLRIFGYGASISGTMAFASVYSDPNTSTGFYDILPFQTTNSTTSPAALNTVTLVTLANATKVRVNSWVRLQAMELLGANAGNSNCYHFEYLRVKSVDTGTGIVTFYNNRQYQYRSTYPSYVDAHSITHGAAGLVVLPDTWDQEIAIHGLAFINESQAIFTAKSIRLVDCVASTMISSGPTTSDVQSFVMERCRWVGMYMEVDKQIDLWVQKECVWDDASVCSFQSASVNKAIIDRCRIHQVLGSPKSMIIRDSYIDIFNIGPVYGVTERIIIANSTILEMIPNEQETQTVVQADVLFANGTLYQPVGHAGAIYQPWLGPNTNSVNPVPWAVPGAKVLMQAPGIGSSQSGSFNQVNATSRVMGAPFTVTDVYVGGAGGTSYCIDTTLASFPTSTWTVTASVSGTSMVVTAISPASALLLAGCVVSGSGPGGSIVAGTTIVSGGVAFPNGSGNLGTYPLSQTQPTITSTTLTITIVMAFLPSPCPRMTVLNSTGCQLITDMSGGPPDLPLWSYFKRSYSGFPNYPVGWQTCANIMGNLVSWVINVINPYTGAAGTMNLTVCMFGYQNTSNNLIPTYIVQTINLKTAGIRTITAAGFSGNVAGDTLVACPFWLTGGHSVTWSAASGGDTLNKMATFTMTAQTDQGTGGATTNSGNTTSGWDVLADTITGSLQF